MEVHPPATQQPMAYFQSPPEGSQLVTLREHWHVAYAEAKCEDVSIVQSSKAFSSGISLYAVADGHNGKAAARHCSMVLAGELERQLGGGPASDDAVRRALARTFIATNDAVSRQYNQSGCTLTAAAVRGSTLTIANVGDSKAILDTGSEVIELTTEHRIGQSPNEMLRLEQAGGRLARVNEYGSGPSNSTAEGVGPVRLWPGGIMVGRAIGDKDVGDILLPNPHIRQIKLPPTGARLIIASDGLWDSMPAGRLARVLRGHGSAKAAAMQAVSSVAACRGGLFNDDVTVIVVDLLPEGCTDFKEVCRQFQGRMRTMLSNPAMATLAEAALQQQAQEQKQPAPRQKKSSGGGLFRCFSKPAVLDEDDGGREGQRSTSTSGRRGYGSNPSMGGGSERSMRGGVARDPSVRGCRKATTVEVMADVDTAHWTAGDFGRAPSLHSHSFGRVASHTPSRSNSMQRPSPSGPLEGMRYGFSVGSLSSEDESVCTPSFAAAELPRAMSLAVAKPLAMYAPGLMRKNSVPSSGERGPRSHGGSLAASMLHN